MMDNVRHLTEAYVAAFDARDLDKVASFLAADFKLTDPEVVDLTPKPRVLDYIAGLFKNNPNLRFSARSIVVGEGSSVIHFTLALQDAVLDGVDIIHWDQGKMVQMWAYLTPQAPEKVPMHPSIPTEKFHTFSAQDFDDADIPTDQIAAYLGGHFEEIDFTPRRAILYWCQMLNLMPLETAKAVIEHPSFENAARVILQEEKFIKNRDVPIGVDLALRFAGPDPSRTEGILRAYHAVAKRIWPKENGINSIYTFLFFASHIHAESTERDFELMQHGLLMYFAKLSNNQLNRLCHRHHALVYKALAHVKDKLISENGLGALARLYFVLSDDRSRLLEMIRKQDLRGQDMDPLARNAIDFIQTPNLKYLFSRVKPKGPVSGRKPRVAICISGQLRGYREAFGSWAEALRFEDIEPHLFVSTWESVGMKALNATHMDRYLPTDAAKYLSVLWVEKTENRFQGMFPHFCELFERKSQVSQQQLMEFYGTPNVEVHPDDLLDARVKNSVRMNYKIEHAWHMAQQSGLDFDLILRIRPDKLLAVHGQGFDWLKCLSTCQSDIVLSDADFGIRLHQGYAVGDQILLASPSVASVVHRPYFWHSYFNQNGGAIGMPDELKPHGTLGGICLMAGIENRRLEGLVLSDKNLLNASPPSLADIKSAFVADRTSETAQEVDTVLSLLSGSTTS